MDGQWFSDVDDKVGKKLEERLKDMGEIPVIRRKLRLEDFRISDVDNYAALDVECGYLRPKVLIAASEMHGLSNERALEYSVMVEFLHLASLIQDDASFMDNSPTRRGKNSVSVEHSDSDAVLASDDFIFMALGPLENDKEITFGAYRKIIEEYKLAGQTIVRGQQLDLDNNRKINSDISLDNLRDLYAMKSGAAFSLSLIVPAAIRLYEDLENSLTTIEKVEDEIELYREIGHWLGVGYQGFDDILGKDTEEDARKKTIVDFKGKMETAREFVIDAENRVRDGIKILKDNYSRDTKSLEYVIDYVFSRAREKAF